MEFTYQKFLESHMDLSALGIMTGADMEAYFCTPKGAEIFGRAGVDGIHYCLIDGFGETVFTVSPMNTRGNYVHPVARSFEDFLRLLLACADAAAIEQAWMWDLPEFDAFLKDNQPTEMQKAVLSQLERKTNLKAMEDPWRYIKDVQSSFDETRIEYTQDYDDPDMNPDAGNLPPAWAVYFDSGFWGHSGKDKAGTEIPTRQEFEFAGRKWVIPAIYSCGKGLVVDFCMQVLAGEIRAFMDKWDLSPANERQRRFSREERLEVEAENPMVLDFTSKAIVNGKALRSSHGCGISYNPCMPKDWANEPQAEWIMDHYELDRSDGWMIWRAAYPWATKRRPNIKTLSLALYPNPVSLPGPRFRIRGAGDSFSFTHPETALVHKLTVVEYERQTMDFSRLPEQDEEYPGYFTAMSYRISPELPARAVSVCDCADADSPRRRRNGAEPSQSREGAAVAMIGIIGGADGPTVLSVGGRSADSSIAVCSSPHFEPVDSVEWRMTFHVNRFEETRIDLTDLRK